MPFVRDFGQHADALIKYEDNSQWGLNSRIYKLSLAQPELRTDGPTATYSQTNTRPRYREGLLSLLEPFREGHIWHRSQLGIPRQQTTPSFYSNPPFHKLGRVLKKVLSERPDCLLIDAVWLRGWRALLHSLPIRARWLLNHISNQIHPGLDDDQCGEAMPHCPVIPA